MMDKEEARARFQEAAISYRAGDAVGALSILDELLDAAPNHPELQKARERCMAALAGTRVTPVPANAPAMRHRANGMRAVIRLLLLILAGCLLAGGAVHGRRLFIERYTAGNAASGNWEVQRARQLEARKALQAERAAAEARRLDALRSQPGYEHQEKDWKAGSVNGLPNWEPGIYRNIPCPSRPEYSFDVYIPLTYRAWPERHFAFLTIGMPIPFPGFLGYTSWAEQNNVILIVMNHVANHTYNQNFTVQDHVLNAVFGSMRLDPRLGMATGASGGARCSWDMVVRHPTRFSGLLMIAFGRGDLGDLPPHVAVSFLHGNQDYNAKSIRRTVQRFRAGGRLHQHREFPGGHEGGPLNLRIASMNWLLQTLRARVR